jgi:hypothetical protein
MAAFEAALPAPITMTSIFFRSRFAMVFPPGGFAGGSVLISLVFG